MDQIEIYKGYNIRVFESSPGKWTAEIRKVDGSLIQILRPGLEDDAQDCLTTDPETMNAEAAILLAARAGCAGDGCCGAWDCRAYRIEGELLYAARLSHAATVDRLLR